MRGKIEYDATTKTWYRYPLMGGDRCQIRGPDICDIAVSWDPEADAFYVRSYLDENVDLDRMRGFINELQRYRDRFGPI